MAGERFCVRNSGAKVVVEGIGDHGCEYMTGGVVVVLGETGKNFAAGMSGGLAFIYDTKGDFDSKCNTEMVNLEELESFDYDLLRDMIGKQYANTNSEVAKFILDNWETEIAKFVKVYPTDYKRILMQRMAESVAA
jgi:glutamate synthase (NADPH/NADH) large chain